MDTVRKLFDTDVSIGSYKMKIIHLAGIVFLIWIIFGHALCSCCRVNVFEGFTEGGEGGEGEEDKKELEPLEKEQKEEKEEKEPVPVPVENIEGFANYSNATFDQNYLTSSDSTFVIDPSKWIYTGSAATPAPKPNYQGLSKDPAQNNIIENMQFAPECCPSAYSTSQGCACMSDDTLDFLASRGGNN